MGLYLNPVNYRFNLGLKSEPDNISGNLAGLLNQPYLRSTRDAPYRGICHG